MWLQACADSVLGTAVEFLGTGFYEKEPSRREGKHSGTAVRAGRSPQVGLVDSNLCFFLCSLVPVDSEDS